MQIHRNISFLLRVSLLLFTLTATCALAAIPTAASLPGTPQTIPGLGTTAFPTSTASPAAQTAFMRGLLLLHLFEYPDADKAFLAAEKLDPNFAMAYWGDAMTFNHGVWNEVDVAAGHAALDKFAPTAAARAARIADPRERAYMAAVELLYDGTGTKAERDLRYATAMQQLSQRYPKDRNAQLFYALALISKSESIRDVPAYLHAAAISKAIFRLEPNNPGAAHYWIHGMDDPAHAAGALEAARALSKIAPDAAHAQHMCSHIFMALGMWDDVVEANLDAIRVGEVEDKSNGLPGYDCGHYSNWLEYGFFQQGRLRAAQQTVIACRQTGVDTAAWMAAHPGQPLYETANAAQLHRRLVNSLVFMQDVALIESQDWNRSLSADTTLLNPYFAVWHHFATGYAAAQRGDLVAAHSALDALRADIQASHSEADVDPTDRQTFAVGADELSGLIQIKEAHYDTGSAEIRHAADTYRSMPFAFGPPVTLVPPEELLGEVLLAHGDPAGARQSFQLALERAPGRTESLLGLARAEHLAGDEASARGTYQKLAAIWHNADTDAPGVAEAHQALTTSAQSSNRQ
ncbi:MAG TPA: tetratricopeptide repeat protein [Acidobacteriaceae bacterium]|jgi:tetratricopeptide (TPR) repeat protein|nr:tetratricopeptide repeat protein [Acidobacteriaceae bacterium]